MPVKIPVLSAKHVQRIINAKQEARSKAIQNGLQLVVACDPKDDLPYLCASAVTISEKIRAREWTALRVMDAYIRSAVRAHASTNCLTEIMFGRALHDAKELDDELAQDPLERFEDRLLLGLPMSLKDENDVEGVDSTIGFTKYCNQPMEKDGSIASYLRKAGAIPFCKTNVPQTMLAFECANPVFGVTTNPYSKDHVPGGSSGGEAALLALDGSALGVGSDIAGSLRIPTSFSGCFALKPVFGRFPATGLRDPAPGFESVLASLGPMGRCVEDVELCFRAIVEQAYAENASRPDILPVPFRQVDLPKKLKLGYFVEDGFVPTSPACKRAVKQMIEAALAAGHECVAVDMPDHGEPSELLLSPGISGSIAVPLLLHLVYLEALEIFTALGSADGYQTLVSHLLPGEPRDPALFLTTLGPRLPGCLRKAAAWYAETVMGDAAMARLIDISSVKSMKEVFEWQDKKYHFTEKVRKRLWGDLALDAIICPVQATPSVTHGATKDLSPLAIHTIFWNTVDSSVGVIPVTRVQRELDEVPANWDTVCKEAASPWLSKKLYNGVYDADKMHGIPIGVQIVGPAWHEEKVLKMMKVLNDALEDAQGRQFGPGLAEKFRVD